MDSPVYKILPKTGDVEQDSKTTIQITNVSNVVVSRDGKTVTATIQLPEKPKKERKPTVSKPKRDVTPYIHPDVDYDLADITPVLPPTTVQRDTVYHPECAVCRLPISKDCDRVVTKCKNKCRVTYHMSCTDDDECLLCSKPLTRILR